MIAKTISGLLYGLMILCLVAAAYTLGEVQGSTGQGLKDFIGYKAEFQRYAYEYPSDAEIKAVDDYNRVNRYLWLGLLCMALYYVSSYYENPKGHLFSYIKEWSKKLKVEP